MTQKDKEQPAIAPGRRTLIESLTLALKDASARRAFVVDMRVVGGVRSQRYSFDFWAAGVGAAQCSFECRLSDRKGDSGKRELPDEDFVKLLRKCQRALELPQEQPAFLPDTLVGIVQISDGDNVRKFYFAADPEQAKGQGKMPSPELLGVVDTIYALGARLTGSRSVKP